MVFLYSVVKHPFIVKRIYGSLLFIVMFMPVSRAQSINTLKWQNRILILMDSKGDTDVLNEQLQVFSDLEEEIKDRDLILLCYNGKQLLDQQLIETTYLLSPAIDVDFQGVVLIGKDGGIKLRKPFPVEPKTIFEIIDSMPMRKAEMRSSGRY